MGRLSKEQVLERERLAESGLKRCSVGSGCGEIKTLNEFGLNKSAWGKKQATCLMCDRKKTSQYRKNNPEVSAAYYREHREQARQYYLDNRDAKLEYTRTHQAKRRQEDPMYRRLKDGKERAQKAGGEWKNISSTDLLAYWKQNNISIDTCYYCKQTVNTDDLQLDHGQPIGRGGSHTVDNLFPAHGRCNMSKKDKTVEEYLEHLMQVA